MGALVNQLSSESLNFIWNRNLVVDLGAQISQTEIEIIEKISVYRDVLLLAPLPEFGRQIS